MRLPILRAGVRRRLASEGCVRTTAGLLIPAEDDLGALADCDVAVACALGHLDADTLMAALATPAGRSVIAAISSLPDHATVAAACTGTFALAEAGRLDGAGATTSWWLAPRFRSLYPGVALDMDSMVVDAGPALTAGASFAHIDLALALVSKVSLELSSAVARYLMVDSRPSQSGYALVSHLAAHDELVTAFERVVRSAIAAPIDLDAAVVTLGTSRRSLERRVRAVTGTTPIGFVQRIRVEHARHLRATTDLTTDAIARSVGYENAGTLRALLRRWPAATRVTAS